MIVAKNGKIDMSWSAIRQASTVVCDKKFDNKPPLCYSENRKAGIIMENENLKIGDLVKYKEPYSKLAYLRKRGMGIITETNKRESRVCFLENELKETDTVWVSNKWLRLEQ